MGARKQPVREIEGVDQGLCARWSRRRRDIEDRTAALRAEFTTTHGRPPSAKKSIALAQRANLDTRAAKHKPRSEAEQRATWRAEALQELGHRGLEQMIQVALNPSAARQEQVPDPWLEQAAARVIAELESRQATWQSWHLYAEAQRQVRGIVLLHEATQRYVDALTTATRRLLAADAEPPGHGQCRGPLPWLPGIPQKVAEHPRWSAYLTARADRVVALARQVASGELPDSLTRYSDALTPQLRATINVWRAANAVPDDDHSLLGPRVTDPTADRYARGLHKKITELQPPPIARWESRIAESLGRAELRGEHLLDLARELDRLDRSGVNAALLLRRATSMRKPLPTEHAVEALTYRVQRIATQRRSHDAPEERRAPAPLRQVSDSEKDESRSPR